MHVYIIVDLVCSPLSVKYGDIEMTAIIVIIIIIIRSFPLHILVASDSVSILSNATHCPNHYPLNKVVFVFELRSYVST